MRDKCASQPTYLNMYDTCERQYEVAHEKWPGLSVTVNNSLLLMEE
jgi:hypothetical protein